MKRLVPRSPAVVFLLSLVTSAVVSVEVEPVLLAALAPLQVVGVVRLGWTSSGKERRKLRQLN